MRRRDLVWGCVLVGLAACSPPSPRAGQTEGDSGGSRAPADPAAAVRPLYDRYLTPDAVFPAFREQAPWSAGLWAQLDSMLTRSEARNEPILDFDPLIGAQDYQLANLNVTTDGVVENSHATVRASFTNLGRPEEVVYDLVWEDGAWRVDNIRGAGWDLRHIAASTEAPATP